MTEYLGGGVGVAGVAGRGGLGVLGGALGGGCGSRASSSDERSRLSVQASSSWAVEGDQSQIAVRCDEERSEELTLWLRSRGAGDRNGQGADGESPDGEEGESSFEEHDNVKCEEEQITTWHQA